MVQPSCHHRFTHTDRTYKRPITLTENTLIRIASWTAESGYSERLNLHINVVESSNVSLSGHVKSFGDDSDEVTVELY